MRTLLFAPGHGQAQLLGAGAGTPAAQPLAPCDAALDPRPRPLPRAPGDDLYGGTSRLLSRVVPSAGIEVSAPGPPLLSLQLAGAGT